jgi:hypothetical protein
MAHGEKSTVNLVVLEENTGRVPELLISAGGLLQKEFDVM